MMLRAWKNDISVGYIYGDPEKDGSFYIHPLDLDYVRIYSSSFYQGVLGVAFDMSYFRTYPDDLEYYDKEFQKLYRQYEDYCVEDNQAVASYNAFKQYLEDVVGLKHFKMRDGGENTQSAFRSIKII